MSKLFNCNDKHQSMKNETAYNKAAFICSKREYCTFQITEKLRDWGIEDEDKVKKIIDRLTAGKFLDDLRFAKAYVNDKIKYNHWGRQKVRFMLKQLHLQGDVVNNILNDFDYNIYEQIAKNILISKSHKLKESDKYKLRQKLIQFMTNRGFELDVYREELDKIINKISHQK